VRKNIGCKSCCYNLSERIKKFLEENIMAIEIYENLHKGNQKDMVSKEILEDYDKLKTRLYEYESLFTQNQMKMREYCTRNWINRG